MCKFKKKNPEDIAPGIRLREPQEGQLPDSRFDYYPQEKNKWTHVDTPFGQVHGNIVCLAIIGAFVFLVLVTGR